MTMVPSEALVVVADGGGARLFRNRGDERSLSLHQVELRELMNMDDDGPAGRESGSGRIASTRSTLTKSMSQMP